MYIVTDGAVHEKLKRVSCQQIGSGETKLQNILICQISHNYWFSTEPFLFSVSIMKTKNFHVA
jgi:hypothetical protein